MTISITLVIALVLSLQVTALADGASGDGDMATPFTPPTVMAFGTVCAGTSVTKTGSVAAGRSGPSPDPGTWANDATLTGTVSSPLPPFLSAVMTDSSITLPSNWAVQPQGSLFTADTATIAVTLTAPSVPTTFNSGAGVILTGPSSTGGTLVRVGGFAITATWSACDTTPPTLNLPADMTVEAQGSTGALVTFSATATDVSPPSPFVTCSPPSGSVFPLGTTIVGCSAVDSSGNGSQGSFTVTVVDTTPPIIFNVPPDITKEAADASGAAVSFSNPSAVDRVDGPVPVSCLPASGTTFPIGSTSVTCTATDSRGNSATATLHVIVADTTDPVLVVADVTEEATGPDGAQVHFAATATDTVDADVTIGCTPPSGSTFPLGATNVSCTAADDAGNSTTGWLRVWVQDTTPPVLNVPDSTSLEATGPSGASFAFAASATDIVDQDVNVSCSFTSGDTLPLGVNPVSCTATDDAGNATTAAFNVTVTDTTAPALTLPDDAVVEATDADGAQHTFAPSATDVVDSEVTVTCTPPSGSVFPLDTTTTVECTAQDDSGNITSGSFTAQVVDTTGPEVTPPANVTANPTDAFGAYVSYGSASASDLVDGPVSATCTPASGSFFPLGVTTVRCDATDAHGNPGSGSFTVRVSEFVFQGFYAPVDNPPAINTVKGGATVQVKWEVFTQDGFELTSTSTVAAGWPKSTTISCATLTGGIEDPIEVTTTGATSLRYDTTSGQFVFSWRSPKSPATCHQVDVKLTDGSVHSALFKLR